MGARRRTHGGRFRRLVFEQPRRLEQLPNQAVGSAEVRLAMHAAPSGRPGVFIGGPNGLIESLLHESVRSPAGLGLVPRRSHGLVDARRRAHAPSVQVRVEQLSYRLVKATIACLISSAALGWLSGILCLGRDKPGVRDWSQSVSVLPVRGLRHSGGWNLRPLATCILTNGEKGDGQGGNNGRQRRLTQPRLPGSVEHADEYRYRRVESSTSRKVAFPMTLGIMPPCPRTERPLLLSPRYGDPFEHA